jgi:hypothetical protein
MALLHMKPQNFCCCHCCSCCCAAGFGLLTARAFSEYLNPGKLSCAATVIYDIMQLFGHVHVYERTKPVRNYYVDECGPVHITIGDGGNIEV